MPGWLWPFIGMTAVFFAMGLAVASMRSRGRHAGGEQYQDHPGWWSDDVDP
jgi:hypothetical protein